MPRYYNIYCSIYKLKKRKKEKEKSRLGKKDAYYYQLFFVIVFHLYCFASCISMCK